MNTIIIDGQQITADARIVAEVERLQGRVAFYDSLAARAGIPADQLPALIADAVGRHRDLVAHQAKVDRFQAGIRARGGICA